MNSAGLKQALSFHQVWEGNPLEVTLREGFAIRNREAYQEPPSAPKSKEKVKVLGFVVNLGENGITLRPYNIPRGLTSKEISKDTYTLSAEAIDSLRHP